jgi:tRNA (mo5U34)-methyltransferase
MTSSVRAKKQRWISQPKKGFLRYRQPFESVSGLRASWCDFSTDVVRIGRPSDISSDERETVLRVLRGFMPWRKGPFSIFGIGSDAE